MAVSYVYQQCLAIIYQLWGGWAGTGVQHADAQRAPGILIFPPTINERTFIVVKPHQQQHEMLLGKELPENEMLSYEWTREISRISRCLVAAQL